MMISRNDNVSDAGSKFFDFSMGNIIDLYFS